MLTEKNMEYLDFMLKKNGRIVVDKSMVDFATRLKETFMNNNQMRELMGMNDVSWMQVYNEVELAMFPTMFEFGIRGIIDNLVIDHKEQVIRINDLKKTSKPLSLFPETMEYYSYWLQAAIYRMIVNHVKNETYKVDYPVEVRFLVIDPYMQMAPFKISDISMEKYMVRTIEALTKANSHFVQKDFSAPYELLTSANREFEV
jgi:hypothetical protein